MAAKMTAAQEMEYRIDFAMMLIGRHIFRSQAAKHLKQKLKLTDDQTEYAMREAQSRLIELASDHGITDLRLKSIAMLVDVMANGEDRYRLTAQANLAKLLGLNAKNDREEATDELLTQLLKAQIEKISGPKQAEPKAEASSV
jgi:hypothetical protein